MKILTDTLLVEGRHDLLNVPSLASMEMIAKRICQIVGAYHHGTGKK